MFAGAGLWNLVKCHSSLRATPDALHKNHPDISVRSCPSVNNGVGSSQTTIYYGPPLDISSMAVVTCGLHSRSRVNPSPPVWSHIL
jgi:hypothetical protein